MKKSLSLVAVCLMLALLFGCASPELERTPYGQDELRWKGFISSNYTGWDPPQSVPPSAMDEPLSTADIPALPPLPELHFLEDPPVPQVPTELTMPQVPTELKVGESYTISKGDTLWSISKKVYGQGGKWRLILDANRDKISDPNKLRPGIVINIPPLP